MIDMNGIPKSYEEAVELLAAWHGSEGIDIYLQPDSEKTAVNFVEVSQDFPDDDRISGVTMGRSNDFPFTSKIILLSQTDWQMVQNGKKTLPDGWNKGELKKVWPHGPS